MKFGVGLAIIFLATSITTGQDVELLAKEYLYAKGTDPASVSFRITDRYTSAHNGVTHVYLVQQYNGIDVVDNTITLNIRDGEVLSGFDRIDSDVDSMIARSDRPALTPEDAVAHAVKHLGHVTRSPLTLKKRVGTNSVVFSRGTESLVDIPVNLVYTLEEDGLYHLAWNLYLEHPGETDMWNYKVSAQTGEILDRFSMTQHCSFDHHFLQPSGSCVHTEVAIEQPTGMEDFEGVYNVIPFPFESPNHGPRQLVSNPADPVASPFGWHDLNGQPGADTTITYGTNVFAYLDRDRNNTPDLPLTSAGQDLVFNFPYDQTKEPEEYRDAAVTNLFYANNYMHDFTYHYGFDELAGNFQVVNNTGLGRGGDNVIAQGQFGADAAEPQLNNANFSTPGDGSSGRMRLFVWTGVGDEQLLQVTDPPEIRGAYNTSTTTTDWGAQITDQPVSGEVVLVDDGSSRPSEGCNPLANGDELAGKIAMIDRGSCEFGEKAIYAEEAGAIGFILCNFEDQTVLMGAGEFGAQVTIPGVFMTRSDCQRLKAQIGNGLAVTLVNQSEQGGPQFRAGSFDNGVIAHEYAHGISNRLTGGPSRIGCLINYDDNNDGTSDNGEQMGEGWSDFFTLITTAKPSHDGSLPRGIGTFASDQDTNGTGIRPYPYTTDMSVNPLTYDDIPYYSVPHGVGTVWCTMLWDLYWALTDEYGFDQDLMTGDGGNNLAVQLVMDGMKMQPCNPGFVDGRDAILAADRALTGGENQKLIWEVFARRGLGYSAEQGDQSSRLDGREAFDIDPLLIEELKLEKTVTPYIEPGDEISVVLSLVNHEPGDISGLTLTDVIPEGTSLVEGSPSSAYTREGDMLVFEIDELASGTSIQIEYSLVSSTNNFSDQVWYDDMENGDQNWAILQDNGDANWYLQEFIANSGTYAWGIENSETESDVSLVTLADITVPAGKPALLFYQQYDLERFFDAGIIQVSVDNGISWQTIEEDRIVRRKYDGKVPYSLFAYQNSRGWHGNTDGWVPTLVDLSDYSGGNILLRWRIGTDEAVARTGWFIDDVEVINAFTYSSEACVTTISGHNVCASPDEWGTLVATGAFTSIDEPGNKGDLGLRVFPNPASDYIRVDIATTTDNREVNLALYSSDGREMWRSEQGVSGSGTLRIATASFPRGFYFLKAQSDSDQEIVKVALN